MNITFIVLPNIIGQRDAKNPKTRSYKAFPYGVLSISSYLKHHSNKYVSIKIIDCNLQDYEESIKLIKVNLEEFKPDIIGLSMLYDISYRYLGDISKIIKQHTNNIITVLGGSAASFSYNEIINEQNYIDAICYTEGELPFTELVNSNNKKELLETHKSWITKKSIQNNRIPEKSFLTNLDDAINIDYSLIKAEDMQKYKMSEAFSPFLNTINTIKKQFFLVTSRGCPYKCIFCATCSGLYNNKIRYASIKSIINHVKYLVKNYGMNVLTIYDDQLLLNKERAKELFRQLIQFNLRIECPNGLSPIFIDEEMAYLMKKAGMDTVILAIEHGSEHMLRKIIHKPLDLKKVKSVVEILRKYNLFIEAFFVIGIPGEKEEHRKETIKFIRDIQFDWCGFNLATPMRGSKLYTLCIENGYIDKNLKIGDIEDKKYIINNPPDLIPEEISKKTYLMNLDINFVNNYRMRIKDYQTAKNCFQDVINRTTNHAFAYYYLAKAQEALEEPLELIDSNIKKFYEIINTDSTWKEYVEYFELA